MFRRFSLVAAVFAAGTLSAAAHDYKVGALTIDHPWARATPPAAKVAGGFMVITNAGTEPDRLLGGSVGFAERVEVHEMAMDGDVMKMRQLADGLEIPAGSSVALKPGSFHMMFMGLATPLKEGDRVPGTLVFEKAGSVEVEFQVDAIGAMGGSTDGHGDHSSHGG